MGQPAAAPVQIRAALPRQIPDRSIPIENQMNELAIVCCISTID
jgi:hypothetical protein